MIKSKFISDILELLLDGDELGLLAKRQLPYLTENKFKYTGSGLFVNFTQSAEIINYTTLPLNFVLDGVKIETKEFPIEANATLFFKNGVIDLLEIWCYLGNYPNQNLTKYTLTQIWVNSPNKIRTNEDETLGIQ